MKKGMGFWIQLDIKEDSDQRLEKKKRRALRKSRRSPSKIRIT